jgi:hypothetical protein
VFSAYLQLGRDVDLFARGNQTGEWRAQQDSEPFAASLRAARLPDVLVGLASSRKRESGPRGT